MFYSSQIHHSYILIDDLYSFNWTYGIYWMHVANERTSIKWNECTPHTHTLTYWTVEISLWTFRNRNGTSISGRNGMMEPRDGHTLCALVNIWSKYNSKSICVTRMHSIHRAQLVLSSFQLTKRNYSTIRLPIGTLQHFRNHKSNWFESERENFSAEEWRGNSGLHPPPILHKHLLRIVYAIANYFHTRTFSIWLERRCENQSNPKSVRCLCTLYTHMCVSVQTICSWYTFEVHKYSSNNKFSAVNSPLLSQKQLQIVFQWMPSMRWQYRYFRLFTKYIRMVKWLGARYRHTHHTHTRTYGPIQIAIVSISPFSRPSMGIPFWYMMSPFHFAFSVALQTFFDVPKQSKMKYPFWQS